MEGTSWQYITIPIRDNVGFEVDNHTLPVNTDEEIEAAETALAEAGIEQAPVWALPGEPDPHDDEGWSNAVKTSLFLFAAETNPPPSKQESTMSTTARVSHISESGDIHLTLTGFINGNMAFMPDGSVSPGTELSPAGLFNDDGYALAVWALAASVGDEIDIDEMISVARGEA